MKNINSISIYAEKFYPCADPEIFVSGWGDPGQSDKKAMATFFFSFFFSPQLILQKSNGQISKKSIIFQGSRGGPTFSRGVGGGPTFSRGGPIAYSL